MCPTGFLPLLATVMLVAASAEEDDCPRTLITSYYKELDCVPRKENNSPCPTSYDCSKYESRDKTKCHYGGKVYDINEELDGTPFGSCKAACKCKEGIESTAPSFTCANIECPIGLFQPRDPECRYLYQPGDCCSSNSSCGDSVKSASITCTHDNKTYIEGERFDGKSCQVCHCKDNFEGRLEEPFCYDIKCDYQLSYDDNMDKGCVPVYFGEEGCCPIEWKCPAKSDKIRRERTKIRQRTNETCKFGSLLLKAGDELQTDEFLLECSCQLPPYVTCYRRSSVGLI